jgi:hypothetical protein
MIKLLDIIEYDGCCIWDNSINEFFIIRPMLMLFLWNDGLDWIANYTLCLDKICW